MTCLNTQHKAFTMRRVITLLLKLTVLLEDKIKRVDRGVGVGARGGG